MTCSNMRKTYDVVDDEVIYIARWKMESNIWLYDVVQDGLQLITLCNKKHSFADGWSIVNVEMDPFKAWTNSCSLFILYPHVTMVTDN